MGRKAYTPEPVIGELREAEILFGKGRTIVEAIREIGVTEQGVSLTQVAEELEKNYLKKAHSQPE